MSVLRRGVAGAAAVAACAILATYAGLAYAAAPRVYFAADRSAIGRGEELRVKVLMESGDPVNALNLLVSYPADLLEFVSADNGSSIVDVWVIDQEKMSFGLVPIGGGIVRGFQGTDGEITTLVFRGRAEGALWLSFTRSDLYYADGRGTLAETRAEDLGAVRTPMGKPTEKTVDVLSAAGLIAGAVLLAVAVFLLVRRRLARRAIG